jgi:hypothetical protein
VTRSRRPASPRERIILAFDRPRLDAEGLSLVQRLAPRVGAVKVGLELYTTEGPRAVEAVPEGRRPWVSVDAVAREMEGIQVVPAGLRGAEALRVLQSSPAGEYLVASEDRVVGVLRTADVARLLRTKPSREGRR